MTAHEAALVRDLMARLRVAERELYHLRRSRTRAWTERRRAKDQAMFLHGVLIAAGVRVKDSTAPGGSTLEGSSAAGSTGGDCR